MIGRNCLLGRDPLGIMGMMWWLCGAVNILNAAELSALKCLIPCYRNFTSVHYFSRNQERNKTTL